MSVVPRIADAPTTRRAPSLPDEDPCDLRVRNRRATQDAEAAERWERHDREQERSE